jgi:hypothetical protein
MRFSIWLRLLTYIILDLIILSDNESVGTKSKTDFSSLNIDLIAKRDSNSLHVADNKLINSNSFSSGTTVISDCVIANNQDDDNNNNSVVDSTKLWLFANCPRLASFSHRSVTH